MRDVISQKGVRILSEVFCEKSFWKKVFYLETRMSKGFSGVRFRIFLLKNDAFFSGTYLSHMR